MALIRFETNMNIIEDRAKVFVKKVVKAAAPVLGEPETEIRVELAGNRKMRMAASDEPIAHLELRNVELPKDRAQDITRAICPVVEETFSIQEHNIYIAVISRRNSMWRVSGGSTQAQG